MLGLTQHERESDLWRKIKEHLEARLQRHRVQNDHAATDHDTAWTRGRIAELKALIEADREPVKVTPHDLEY